MRLPNIVLIIATHALYSTRVLSVAVPNIYIKIDKHNSSCCPLGKLIIENKSIYYNIVPID